MVFDPHLELLRGEAIGSLEGDPMDIPCIETSDAERLCKHPVVSVDMITYNHEPYIRQAIEGVMMQKTDFEFELVIGEDCSTDRTREICFEYQKKHPDKIRVLWWHENLRKVAHPAGGNGARTMAHCRGEFIAYCEGDDYWTDPSKLQKQVDAFRAHPSVGMCFCRAQIYNEKDDAYASWEGKGFRSGLMTGREFMVKHLWGEDPVGASGDCEFLMTATVMARRSILEKTEKFPMRVAKLYLGDSPTWLSLAAAADVFFLPDDVSVYRQNAGGAMSSAGAYVSRDAAISRLSYAEQFLGVRPGEMPSRWRAVLMACNYALSLKQDAARRRNWVVSCLKDGELRKILLHPQVVLSTLFIYLGLRGVFYQIACKVLFRYPAFASDKVLSICASVKKEHPHAG